MPEFISDLKNEKGCEACICNIKAASTAYFEYTCDTKKAREIMEKTGKNCFVDLGYYVEKS